MTFDSIINYTKNMEKGEKHQINRWDPSDVEQAIPMSVYKTIAYGVIKRNIKDYYILKCICTLCDLHQDNISLGCVLSSMNYKEYRLQSLLTRKGTELYIEIYKVCKWIKAKKVRVNIKDIFDLIIYNNDNSKLNIVKHYCR